MGAQVGEGVNGKVIPEQRAEGGESDLPVQMREALAVQA